MLQDINRCNDSCDSSSMSCSAAGPPEVWDATTCSKPNIVCQKYRPNRHRTLSNRESSRTRTDSPLLSFVHFHNGASMDFLQSSIYIRSVRIISSRQHSTPYML